jgi:hypothetical protein
MSESIKEYNCETGETIEREMNANELKENKAWQAAYSAKKEAETLKETQKAALLERLGITADEAALLLS